MHHKNNIHLFFFSTCATFSALCVESDLDTQHSTHLTDDDNGTPWRTSTFPQRPIRSWQAVWERWMNVVQPKTSWLALFTFTLSPTDCFSQACSDATVLATGRTGLFTTPVRHVEIHRAETTKKSKKKLKVFVPSTSYLVKFRNI